MKILITNHHLVSFGGTEVFTLELAKGLKNLGHQVVVYSKFVDKLGSLFKKEKIAFHTDLSLIKSEHFDIAHVQHNISAMEVRSMFPTLPIFYLSHGAVQFLEQPPKMDLNISLYGGVSAGIAAKMNKNGIHKNKIVVFHNIVDEKRFASKKAISATPKKALLLSAKIDKEKEKIIKEACKILRIKLVCVGGRFKEVPYYDIPKYINAADIVFTIGRGAIESMMCGRIPLIFDVHGGDGMVTPDNFSALMTRNFTGKLYKKNYTVTQLIAEIQKYHKNNGPLLKTIARQHFSLTTQIPRIVGIYENTIRLYQDKKIDESSLNNYMQTIKASVYYQARMGNSQLHGDYIQYKQKLDEITSSQFFKLWPYYENIKRYFAR